MRDPETLAKDIDRFTLETSIQRKVKYTAADIPALERENAALGALAQQLELSSPLKTMKRGFALARDRLRQPVRSAKALTPGDQLTLSFFDGDVQCTVDAVRQ